MLTLAQLSDIHFILDPPNQERARQKIALDATLSQIKSMRRGIDAVLITGDLVNRCTAHQRCAYTVLQAKLADLALPVMVIGGNHDQPAHLAQAFAHPHRAPAPFDWQRDFKGFRWIGLDSSRGKLSATSLLFLKTALQKSPLPVIIGVHHPIIRTGVLPQDRQQLKNRGAFWGMVAAYRHKVRAILTGHAHYFIAQNWGNMARVIAPSPINILNIKKRNTIEHQPQNGGFVLHFFDHHGVKSQQILPI